MDTTRNVAEAVAARLGGVAGIGLEVHSDADLADAVANGFRVKSIDALRDGGVTEAEVGSLIIKAHRWLHRNSAALGDRKPMDLIRTEAGARVVENLLARIAWGAAA